MATMRAKNQIASFEIRTHSHRDRFFSYIQMDESWKPRVAVQFLHLELEQS